jgi:hypothetical protein
MICATARVGGASHKNVLMRELLKKHPQTPCGAAIQIEAAITCSRPYCIELSYFVTGQLEELSIPPTATPRRADELWRHTCFEAFIQTAPTGYYEFNFAPTTAWAAYGFTGYRHGKSLAAIPIPAITVHSDPDRYCLQASLNLRSLYMPGQPLWHLGLSAVFEDKSGRLSYWALAHASDKPDFHRSESFVHEFSPVLAP